MIGSNGDSDPMTLLMANTMTMELIVIENKYRWSRFEPSSINNHNEERKKKKLLVSPPGNKVSQL